ncbi:MAG: threonine aldolase [Saprospiraceae bacterium]|nr:threonine aldolase [Saprospiraceae bacterium]MBK7525459.1 threonine aldolase [Saprospiraceae bacterium]MBK8370452.1 threonine aldolase [Saprospiraceae bacterium]MBK8817752.1 threonine aldolase [Saprospiraceae bacterium]MBK8854694.1 threonine aldolase [Saprospiraceae bacterium]
MEVNIISDTVTKPSKQMLDFMLSAEVGDDVFAEDPTVNALESRLSKMFGMDSALFCPSGTMTNQIAIKVHTKSLDEMICDIDSHVYQAESSGFAFHSGISVNLIHGINGKINAEQISASLRPGFDWQPLSKLVVLENTTNKGGGSYYTLDEISSVYKLTRDKGLKLHIDGARIFNALIETNEPSEKIGLLCDSISVCFSKGLGAPVGSILIGDKTFIREARRFRKVMGGGMRQSGILAAACLYALNHHIPDLKIDNTRAKELGTILKSKHFVKQIKPVYTNIIIFILADHINTIDFLNNLKSKGILASEFGHQTIRFVMHRDITPDQFDFLIKIIESL